MQLLQDKGKLLNVKAGQGVALTFKNNSVQHLKF
jgi:hypothetical protein